MPLSYHHIPKIEYISIRINTNINHLFHGSSYECEECEIYEYYSCYKTQWINPLYLIYFWNYILCIQKSFTKELTRYHNYEGLLFIHFILHFVLPLHFLCSLTCKLFIYGRFYSFVIYFYVPYKSGYVSNCQKQKSCNN